MTEQEKMWAELAKHQPIADQKGYGEAWAHMCGLKTKEAAKVAWGDVLDVEPDKAADWAVEAAMEAAKAAVAAWEAAKAAEAAMEAAKAAEAAMEAADWAAERAIKYVQKSNELWGMQ